jgi:hypothetical protein
MNRLICATILLILMGPTFMSCTLHALREDKPEPVAPLEGYGTLDKFPFREAWYGTYFQEDKIGYSHFKIEPSGRNYEISSDSVIRLTAMKKTNEIKLKEAVTVRPDLTLVAFLSSVHMNGKDLRMTGETRSDRLSLDIRVEGETSHHEYPFEGNIYHTSAISLLPAMRGLKDGANHSFSVFNAEKQGVQKVDQQVLQVRGDPGPQDAVWQVKNTYGRSVVQSWLNRQGLTVLEKGLEGSLITVLEDEGTAKKFLESKTAGKDLILDFSLIRLPKPLTNAEKLRYLKVKMQGVDPSVIAEDHRQKIIRRPDKITGDSFDVVVRVEDLSAARTANGGSTHPSYSDDHLASTVEIQADHAEIAAQGKKIVADNDPPLEKITKLVHWTADNIKSAMRYSFAALEVLRVRSGECKSHANLYAALARSQKIPTRVITGLVYSNEGGFSYHAWAESYANGWIAVDPTLKQVPADATHIKIAASDSGSATDSLLKMMGKVKMEVLEHHN